MGKRESIFSGRFKRVTEELILSAILVSFLEATVLWALGFLKEKNISSFLAMTGVLAVIEIILIILIEEVLISAKVVVKRAIKRRKTKKDGS